LYDAIVADVRGRSEIVDLTVEGPTPQFQRMRDVADLKRISAGQGALVKTIRVPIEPSAVVQLRKFGKLSKAQAWRCALVFALRNMRAGGQDQSAFKVFLKKRLTKDHEVTYSVFFFFPRSFIHRQTS